MILVFSLPYDVLKMETRANQGCHATGSKVVGCCGSAANRSTGLSVDVVRCMVMITEDSKNNPRIAAG